MVSSKTAATKDLYSGTIASTFAEVAAAPEKILAVAFVGRAVAFVGRAVGGEYRA